MDDERYIMDIKTICPECGEPLEVDYQAGREILLCPNPKCSYEKDVTSEFRKANEINGED